MIAYLGKYYNASEWMPENILGFIAKLQTYNYSNIKELQ
jgi:hypothetical protein